MIKENVLLSSLYECELWSLILREEKDLGGLRTRCFGSKSKEVKVGLKEMHSEKLYNLFTLSGIVRVMK
jgi:hypothetical protein